MGTQAETDSRAAYRAAYDEYAEEYLKRVGETRTAGSVSGVAAEAVLEALGDVRGLDLCDLGCGEGHLAREMARRGARVTGVDVSGKLLAYARERERERGVGAATDGVGGFGVAYVREDAQTLVSVPAESFDVVVCNLALMDMPDAAAVFAAVARVLRRGGRFVLSLLHPCFLGPYSDVLVGDDGRYRARLVPEYVREGFWRSKNPVTLRGRLGAHHRTLSTYLNGLLAAGFALRGFREPVLAPGDYAGRPFTEALTKVPPVLLVEAVRPT